MAVLGGGYLFSYFKSIVAASAYGDDDIPGWPEVSSLMSDMVGPFFQFIAILLVCLAPGGIAFWTVGPSIGWPLLTLGLFYLPMALVAVSVLDSLGGLNPGLVLRSISRTFGHYLAVCAILLILMAVRGLGMALSGYLPLLLNIAMTELVSLYFLIVMMRVLGCLYYVNRHKLQWA